MHVAAANLENSLAVSFTIKRILLYDQTIAFVKHLPKGNEFICTHTDLFMNVHRTFVHNNQKLII